MTMQKPKPKTSRHRRAPKLVPNDPTLWEDLAAIGRSIPKESIAKLLRDLGRNADHYLDGSPKHDE